MPTANRTVQRPHDKHVYKERLSIKCFFVTIKLPQNFSRSEQLTINH